MKPKGPSPPPSQHRMPQPASHQEPVVRIIIGARYTSPEICASGNLGAAPRETGKTFPPVDEERKSERLAG
jgi:hypothetical protein